jgi:murein DD-endopeptidase MepM/ murein hydrolase activator NlpD
MALPIKNGKITLGFGVKGTHWASGHHEGVDFAVPVGTPVLAVADGTVSGVGTWGSAFGSLSPVINHGKGNEAIYAHVSKVYVKAGQQVTKGQHIADSGAVGNVTGPHLHFERQMGPGWKSGGGLDPQNLLNA